MDVVNVGKIARALRRIGRIPFLGTLLRRSRLGPIGSVVAIIVLWLAIYRSPAALSASLGSSEQNGILLLCLFALQLLSYLLFPLMLLAVCGVIGLNLSISQNSLGSYREWMESFFGSRRRIPIQFPKQGTARASAVVALLLAGTFLIAGIGLLFAAGGLLLANGTLAMLMYGFGENAEPLWDPRMVAKLAATLLPFLPGGLVLALHYSTWRRFRRLTAVPSRDILLRDPRAPILFLRSFRDDALKTKPGFLSLHIGKPFRFEEKIAIDFWREGPVVAIGKPGEALPEFGACREYHSDDTWQARVLELMKEAKGVFMLVGITEALGWEIHQLREHGALEKSIFIMPPLTPAEIGQRLEKFGSQLPEFAEAAAKEKSLPNGILCIVFGADGEPVAFTSRRRATLDYSAAVHAAFARVNKRPSPHVSRHGAETSAGELARGNPL